MKASIKTLEEVFEPEVRFVAPTHQRRYAWKQEKQWEPLLQDLLDVVELILENEQQGAHPHFLGSVVIAPSTAGSADDAQQHVIDGQQRLTTLQLLIDAAAHVVRGHKLLLEANRLDTLVRNDEGDDGEGADFKVLPNVADRTAYRRTLTQKVTVAPGSTASPVERAWHFFYDGLMSWMEDDLPGKEQERRLKALCQALRGGMRMSIVELSPEDNAHRVFETMNALGEPLLVYDLVKNHLLQTAAEETLDQESFYTNYLRWIDEDDSWRETIKSGRESRPWIDQFMYDWLQVKQVREIRQTNVYREYLRYSQQHEGTVEALAKDLLWFGSVFDDLWLIDSPTREDNAEFFGWLALTSPHAFSPPLLWLISEMKRGKCEQANLRRALRVLESFLVRRALCRLPTERYRGLAIRYLKLLTEQDDVTPEVLLAELLDKDDVTRAPVPTDDELVSFLVNNKAGEPNRQMIVAVLAAIRRDEVSELPGVTIDESRKVYGVRIIPKDWTDQSWPQPRNLTSNFWVGQGGFSRGRDTIVSSLGNYTLSEKRLDPALAGRPWPERAILLREHCVLPGDRELFAQDELDDNDIIERGGRLAERICEIWPHPR